jgi:hypothetical protein
LAKSKKRKTAKKHIPTATPPAKPVIPERLQLYTAALDIPATRKQARLLSLLFCDFANRTGDDKVNLLGIFDRVYVHPEIRKSPPFVLYARAAEAFEDSLWVRVFDPDNQPLVEVRFDVNLAPPRLEHEEGWPKQIQFLLPIQLTLKKEGVYWFDIAYRDFSLGGAGLVVKFRKIEEGESGTDTFL